jgi:hypothetical protein
MDKNGSFKNKDVKQTITWVTMDKSGKRRNNLRTQEKCLQSFGARYGSKECTE